MAKITDPDNIFYSEYTFQNSIDPETANNGLSANMLIDYENKRFALTAPRYGVIASGLSSEMVGYGATGGLSGQALYSKFKNIWKEDPVAIRFPFPMEAITPESFEFINGWLPDDQTVSLQTGVNSPFITRKLIKDAGWAERTTTGEIARRYFGTITLGAIALKSNSGFTTVYYNAVNPGIQTSFVIDTDGSVDSTFNRLVFDGVVGNGNTYSTAPYFYTGDSIVYQTDGTETVAGLTTNNVYYLHYATNGSVPTGTGHSISLHTTRENALSGVSSVALIGSTAGKLVTLTASGTPEDLFFGVSENGSSANEPVQFFATANDDGSTVLYNRDNFYELFVREEERTFSKQNIADIGVSQLNFQAYRFPLTSATDINFDATIGDGNGTTTGIATAAYAGIGISFYQTPVSRTIVGTGERFFNLIINCDQQSLNTVYTKVHYLLRQPIRVNSGIAGTDVNSLSGIGYLNGNGGQNEFDNSFRYGAVQQPLLNFVGNRLDALSVDDIFNLTNDATATSGNLANLGIYFENVAAADVNNVTYIDNNGATIAEAFTATVDLTFNNNLFGDGEAKFWTFYDIPVASSGVIPGLSTAISLDTGVDNTTAGILGNSFTVGAGISHPFVTGQKVVAIGQQENPGVGFAMTTLFVPTSLGSDGQGITSYTYYLNVVKSVGVAQTYVDITESGTSPNVIGVGLTDRFRLHATYSDAIANNFAGINTIALTVQAAVGVVTFRQLDVNFSENNATVVKTGGVSGSGVGANEFLDGIDIPNGGDVTFSYDYDGNVQRNRIPATDANIRVVAVGLQTGQYASASASIARAKGQAVSIAGALERVYANPAN